MSYHMSRTVSGTFEDIVERAREELSKEGFGVLTEIDVKATLKKKLDVEFRPYLILGACNPTLAHQVLAREDKVGVLLPCNVVVQERDGGKVEVSAMDPAAAMTLVDDPEVGKIAATVRDKLQKAVDSI